MVLSDKTIKQYIAQKKLLIFPFEESLVQPSSYNVSLGNSFRIFKNISQPFLDIKEPIDKLMELQTVDRDKPLIIHPGLFVLSETTQYFEFPDNLIGRLEGRTSLGRLGIQIHAEAGYFEPGFKGTASLNISNLSNVPVALYPGMEIAQMVFEELTTPAETPYGSKKLGSKYQGQRGPTESKLFKDFIKKVKNVTKR